MANKLGFAYDANGNTTSKTDSTGTTTYTWDFENRLASVTLPGSGGTASFKYDPFGRRIYKSSSSATSVYAFDGDNVIEETNSSGTALTTIAPDTTIPRSGGSSMSANDNAQTMLHTSGTMKY